MDTALTIEFSSALAASMQPYELFRKIWENTRRAWNYRVKQGEAHGTFDAIAVWEQPPNGPIHVHWLMRWSPLERDDLDRRIRRALTKLAPNMPSRCLMVQPARAGPVDRALIHGCLHRHGGERRPDDRPGAAVPVIVPLPILTAPLQTAAAVPPTVEQRTDDCVRPVYATNMLVCDDPELRALDERLRAVAPATSYSPLLEDRAAWFRRSRCAFQAEHRACAAAAYGEALAVAEAVAPTSLPGSSCVLPDGTSASLAPLAAGAALIRAGRIVAVGVPETAAWRPSLRYESRNCLAIFRDLYGTIVARCRVDP